MLYSWVDTNSLVIYFIDKFGLTNVAHIVHTLSFIDIRFQGTDWQYVTIGFGNDWTPNRWQAFTWTNDSKVLRHHMAQRGQNELNWL